VLWILVGFSEQIKVLFISRLAFKLCKIVLVLTAESILLGITECKNAFYSGASDGPEVFISLCWHQRRHKHYTTGIAICDIINTWNAGSLKLSAE